LSPVNQVACTLQGASSKEATMPTVSVELRNVAGTEAALGWAGAHTIVVDRPEGHARGRGLGFNGPQLLALTIGGCFLQ
jgi:organic hydroperoxide reductase OsmC/OhrA